MTIKEQIQCEVEDIVFLPSKHDSKLLGYVDRKGDDTIPLYHSINFHLCSNLEEAKSKMDALGQFFRTADGFDNCILGIFKRGDKSYVLLYDRWKVIMQLKSEYMQDKSGLFNGEEDCETSAIEFYEYNIIDAYMEGVPAFATIYEDEE